MNCKICRIKIITNFETKEDRCNNCMENLNSIKEHINNALEQCRQGTTFNSRLWVELNDRICEEFNITKQQWGFIRNHQQYELEAKP